ncbi:MAG: hypothetical protein J6A04_04630 [Clostridia bacterium]|nr:hypothetical protein [Clostridia bacterium]
MTRSKKAFPKLKIREESFGNGNIQLRELEPNTGRWEVIDFQELNLRKLSKDLFKLLKSEEVEYYVILIGNAKLNKSFSEEEVYETIANSLSTEDLRKVLLH